MFCVLVSAQHDRPRLNSRIPPTAVGASFIPSLTSARPSIFQDQINWAPRGVFLGLCMNESTNCGWWYCLTPSVSFVSQVRTIHRLGFCAHLTLLTLVKRITTLPVKVIEILYLDKIKPGIAGPLEQRNDLRMSNRLTACFRKITTTPVI